MPSVGMRRSTRVLVVKGGEGATVLRSGRRLWPDSDGGRLQRTDGGGDEWMQSSEDGKIAHSCKVSGWHRPGSKQAVALMAVDASLAKPMALSLSKVEGAGRAEKKKMWGSVYQRKRKRLEEGNSVVSKRSRCLEDFRFGKYYVRRRRRAAGCLKLVAAVVDASQDGALPFVSLLGSILGYMMRVRLRLRFRELYWFLMGGSIHEVFASNGIRFLLVPPSSGSGICKFFGANRYVPLFSVDYLAVSSCFLYMRISMLLRSRCLSSVSLTYLGEIEDTSSDEDSDGSCSVIASERDLCSSKALTLENVGPVLCQNSAAPKVAARNVHYRNGFNSLSFYTKRRSKRSRRVRNSSLFSLPKANGGLVPRFSRIRSDDSTLSAFVSGQRLRSSFGRKSLPSMKEQKSTIVGVREDIDSISCSANLLICESDRCYREEGASVMLEFSTSRQWVLAVKRGGILRYTHVGQKVMRACTSNRFTHAVIWSSEDGWKLEFPDRGNWTLFKELYKECSDRNAQAPIMKIIPVPGVREVPDYNICNSATFFRPDSYIVFNDDEVSRAMAKRTANYDMDSEDEEWLRKFNEDMSRDNELDEPVSAETFELMVDAFEKAQFCSPDDYSDENTANDLCLDLGRREVVKAVFGYWNRKRKQKRSALVRIFQFHQPRAQLIPKSVLRKRRSFKRQASKTGRGKQRVLLQALAAERDAMEEHNAMLRVEEAKVSADRAVELAIRKRRRAQMLMENADLAVYKATMALRIAEVARMADSSDATGDNYFID